MLIPSLSLVPIKTWLLLLAGPALLLVAIVGVSVLLSLRGTDTAVIAERVPLFMPQILLGMLVGLGFLVLLLPLGFIWSLPSAVKTLGDVVIGAWVGVFLAFSYLYWMNPAVEVLQRTVGDYVPPGSVLPAMSGSIGVFFIANVVLAPLIEETLYRGYAIVHLTAHLGLVWALALSCLFFGLLHWPGGIWYMLLTGVVAGGAFSGLFLWRDGIWAPFAAHLTLNIIEFVYVWRSHAIST